MLFQLLNHSTYSNIDFFPIAMAQHRKLLVALFATSFQEINLFDENLTSRESRKKAFY